MKKVLGKLFGGGKSEEPAAEPARRQARSPRVRVPLVDGASFVAEDGKNYALRNLSETGLALLSPGAPFPDRVKGQLRVGGESVPVELTTVRRNGDEAGVRITGGEADVRALLRRVFSDEFKALEMTEVDSSRQKKVPVGNPKWFYAPGHFELFFVEHENKLLRFELEWNGNFLALADDGTLRFGAVNREEREETGHAKSELVNWADSVSPEQRAKALRLVENVSGLEAASRERLVRLLSP